MLTHSFEDLAQTFRVMGEAYLKLHQLISIDRPEAVGTLETALNAMLNSYHNLYDLMQQRLNGTVDWYATPELCVILAIRNARHHNAANRIRSVFNYHSQNNLNPTSSQKYLFVDFPSPPEEVGGDCYDVPLSWEDLNLLLSLPRSESRLRAGTKELLRQYLNADRFEAEATDQGLEQKDIFINFVPLALNAGITIAPFIKDHITNGSSVEADFFIEHFQTTGAPITRDHEYSVVEFFLPN